MSPAGAFPLAARGRALTSRAAGIDPTEFGAVSVTISDEDDAFGALPVRRDVSRIPTRPEPRDRVRMDSTPRGRS